MKTELLSVDEKALKKAEALLLAGQVVAFPTETVYGLGAWAFSEEGIRHVYEAKGRPSDNPLIVHVAPGMDLHEIASEIPEKAKELMKRFWPGPLTLILPKTDKVPLRVTGGLSTVAITDRQDRPSDRSTKRQYLRKTESDQCPSCYGGSSGKDPAYSGRRRLSGGIGIHDRRFDRRDIQQLNQWTGNGD